MEKNIAVEGSSGPPAESVLRNLAGSVLHVFVGGVLRAERTALGEFFRFARVVRVDELLASAKAYACARRESSARYRVTVEWEAGYQCPEGNELCENCLDGVVTSGAEGITFSDEPSSDVTYKTTFTVDLTSKRKDDA